MRYEEWINMKVVGYQWYWSTKIGVVIDGEQREIEYLTFTKNREIKLFRLLEIDSVTVLPIKTDINIIMTGGDVIHSYAIPALGIKRDTIPGVCNTAVLRMDRESIYAGSCLEGCGTGHYSMSILIRGVSISSFIAVLGIDEE